MLHLFWQLWVLMYLFCLERLKRNFNTELHCHWFQQYICVIIKRNGTRRNAVSIAKAAQMRHLNRKLKFPATQNATQSLKKVLRSGSNAICTIQNKKKALEFAKTTLITLIMRQSQCSFAFKFSKSHEHKSITVLGKTVQYACRV